MGHAEPKWLNPWQESLATYIKSLKESDFQVELKEIKPEDFKDHSERERYLLTGYSPLLSFLAKTISIPAKNFTWEGMWRADKKCDQPFLQDEHHQLKQGQWWIPTHPNATNFLAWAYTNKAEWNPYAGNENVGRRAAVTSMNDLMAWTEDRYYYGDKKSSKEGKRYGTHYGTTGFTLTFQAFTFYKVKHLVPEPHRSAWQEGLKFMCKMIGRATPGGPMNMRFAAPVGLYYAYLATQDPEILRIYRKSVGETVFGSEHSAAGYHLEGSNRAPDGSYQGIALHRVAELYSITQDPNLLILLRESYRLKGLLSLPQANGKWISASHYNDRCQSGFANDQYQGRETQFVLDVPESVPFLRYFRSNKKMIPLAEKVSRDSTYPNKRVPGSFPWGGGSGGNGGRMHDWGNVLHLPDYIYHQDERKIQSQLDEAWHLPVLSSDRFEVNLNNEMHCVRRPAYYATFYGGSVVQSDSGGTNYFKFLKYKGGYLNGFGGGSLSSLWTPAGTFLIGRMTAYEAYDRQEVKTNKRVVQVPGWNDWATQHFAAKTKEGKILSTARTSRPKSEWDSKKQHLSYRGKMVTKTKRQGTITDAKLLYERHFSFGEKGFLTQLTFSSDRDISFAEAYDSIPLHITKDLKVSFTDATGQSLNAQEVVPNVSSIVLKRDLGQVTLRFSKPVTIHQKGIEVLSKQSSAVFCRSLQIECPTDYKAGESFHLEYEVICETEPGKGMQVIPHAKAYPELSEMEIPSHYLFAHYDAKQGVSTDKQGVVTEWKDLGPNGFHLSPLKKREGATLRREPTPHVHFAGKHGLAATFEKRKAPFMTILTVAHAKAKHATKGRIHSRLVSFPGAGGTDHGTGHSMSVRFMDKDQWTIHKESPYYYKKAIYPAAIGLGCSLGFKKDQLNMAGQSLSGDIAEAYVFWPKLPVAFQRVLVKKLQHQYQDQFQLDLSLSKK